VLLEEPQRRVQDDDDEDGGGVEEIPEPDGYPGGRDEDESQHAGELRAQEAPRAPAPPILELVGAVSREPLLCFLVSQAGRR
jgi:hypothetical protein